MDVAQITARVKAILTHPKTEWTVISAEPASVGSLYTGYIMILAALPAIAGFIKGSLIGYDALGVTVRQPFMSGIGTLLLTYVLALVMVYVMALVINALAPTFDGRQDQVQALKVVAYAWTAAWIAAVAVIVPWLGVLIALAGVIYACYLLYLGLPPTMQCPREKAGVYTAVSVIIAMVLSWLLSLLVAGPVGTAGFDGPALGSAPGTSAHGMQVTYAGTHATTKPTGTTQGAEPASEVFIPALQGAMRLAPGSTPGADSAANTRGMVAAQLAQANQGYGQPHA